MGELADEFTPSRLLFARSRAGLTRVKLARQVGVSTRMLAYYEDGAYAPPPDVISAIAEVLDVPQTFFAAAEIAAIPEDAASFRALSKMSAGRRDAALSTGALAIELNRWLEAHLILPIPDVPRYERAAVDPVGAAQRLRFEWELGYAPIPNMLHLLEAHGVRVFCLPEDLVDIDAYSFRTGPTPMIMINTRKSGERGRFDLAHELGHLVLHGDYDLPRGRERELEANRFAAAFLMPENDVLGSNLRNANAETVLRAKIRWGVAATALAHRLHELGITTDWTYTSTCRRLAQLGFQRGEPGGVDREQSRLLGKALSVLRGRGLTTADLAADLHLRPSTVRDLLFGLVLTGLDGDSETSVDRKPALRLVE